MPDVPPIPVIELIAQNVEDTLRGIVQVAGYSCDLTVERANPGVGNRDRNNLAVIVQGNPTREQDAPMQHDSWRVPFSIVCTAVESETSQTPIDARLNRLWADVIYALCGTESSRRRGGYAIDTIIDDPDFGVTATNAHEGEVTVNVTVWYRHLQGRPHEQ
jgi:hypothetical protein